MSDDDEDQPPVYSGIGTISQLTDRLEVVEPKEPIGFVRFCHTRKRTCGKDEKSDRRKPVRGRDKGGH